MNSVCYHNDNVLFNLHFYLNFCTLVLKISFNDDSDYCNVPCHDVVDGMNEFDSNPFRTLWNVVHVWVTKKFSHNDSVNFDVNFFSLWRVVFKEVSFDNLFNEVKDDDCLFNLLNKDFVTFFNLCCLNSVNFLVLDTLVRIYNNFHTLNCPRWIEVCTTV